LGTAGIAAVAVKPTGAESAPSAEPAMKIACSTVNFRTLSLREAMARIRRAGYEYFEPQATGSWCPHIDVGKDDPQAFRRLVQEFGFKGATGMWTLHGAIVGDPESIKGISQSIRWAKEAGIPVVNAGDGVKPNSMSEADALAILRDRLGKILEVAERCQVYLAIEPHGTFSLTADGLRELMGLTTSKWLGINYDTANVHRTTYAKASPGAYSYQLFGKRQDEVATLRAVVDRVVHVHLKDVVGARCTALGDGTVNVAGCLRVLRQHKYQGVISLETEGEYKPEEMQRLIERSRAYILRVLGQ
jgi:sugar phosphate isomerase/epimerase